MTTLPTIEACAAAGITPRMAQIWDERGVVVPARIPVSDETRPIRQYTIAQVRALIAVREFRNRKLGIKRLRFIAPKIEIAAQAVENAFFVIASADKDIHRDTARMEVAASLERLAYVLLKTKAPVIVVRVPAARELGRNS